MYKRISKFLLMMLVMLAVFCCSTNGAVTTAAASNTQTLKKGDGTTLTYRGSSEGVLALSDYDYPEQEMRAVWVSAFAGDIHTYSSEGAYKLELNSIFNNMETMGLNTIVFHIRTHNNAFYDSELNPLAESWKNVNFDVFDPLEWTINEAHSRGIEFHAWLNPYRIDDSKIAEPYPTGHPAGDSSKIIQGTSGRILDPAIPSNRDFIVDTCMEVIDKYDVDAIHFDDYFYISGSEDSTSYNKYNYNNLGLADFRREQVDLFIEDLHNTMRSYNLENNRRVQLGISPSGIYRNGSYSNTPQYNANGDLVSPLGSNTAGFAHYDDYLYSDTLKWINEEWIDYITPQSYLALEHTAASFAALTRWWSWAVKYKDVNLYMGMGVYMLESSVGSGAYWQQNATNEIKNQLLNAGMYDEIGGVCFYKYGSLMSSNAGIIAGKKIMSEYFAKKLPGAVVKSYADVTDSIPVDKVSNIGDKLSWNSVDNTFGYMVYKTAKGTPLNKNYDSLVEYTQNTYLEGVDTSTYDYYVATVNKANEISNAVSNSPLTPSDIMDLIDDIPSTITLDDMTIINTAESAYIELSTSDKLLVTNYDKLEAAIEKINEMLEFNEFKNDSIEELSKYVDITLYSVEYKTAINKIIDEFEDLIVELTTVDEVNDLITKAHAAIDKLPTFMHEKKIEALVEQYDLTLFNDKMIEDFNILLKECKNDIISKKTVSEMDEAVSNSKIKLDDLYGQYMVQIKIPDGLLELEKIYDDNNYQTYSVLTTIYEEAIEKLNSVTSIAQITEVIDNFENDCLDYINDVLPLIDYAIAQANELSTEGFSSEKLAEWETILADLILDLKDAKNAGEVSGIQKTITSEYNKLTKPALFSCNVVSGQYFASILLCLSACYVVIVSKKKFN